MIPKKAIERPKINENERKVLGKLVYSYSEDDWRAWHFKGLVRETGLELKQVRRACRSLAKKGYARYERALWSDDGPAGAGYRATKEGHGLFDWCHHEYCGEVATQDDDGYKTCDKHGYHGVTKA